MISTDHVDLPELVKRDIKIGYTPDVLTAAGKYRFSFAVNDMSVSSLSRRFIRHAGSDGREKCG